MLDFSIRKNRYWTVILADGTKLEIPEPTAAIYGETQVMMRKKSKRINDLDGMAEEIGDTIDLVLAIFNTNKQKIVFERDEVGTAFSLMELTEILQGYKQFMDGVTDDPNSKSLIVPEKTTTGE